MEFKRIKHGALLLHVYKSSSFWLLGAESLEKEKKTACKAEQIHN